MTWVDFHMHTDASEDSDAPLRSMCDAAVAKGLCAVAVTDHLEMVDYEDYVGTLVKSWRDSGEAVPAYAGRLRIARGIELGEPHARPDEAKKLLSEQNFDFVLGSLHNLRGKPDFYEYPYTSEEQCAQLNREYLAELLELTEFPYFDTMAHIGYTSRYMHRDGFSAEITAEAYRDELAAVYEALIAQGRGIEINVSGLRTGHTSYPNASALALYYDLGGEILTLGSDAHTPEDASVGYREGSGLLRTSGFRY